MASGSRGGRGSERDVCVRRGTNPGTRLWRGDAERLHLPEGDFWVFDSRLVARLIFDDADNLTGAEIITEPAAVNLYLQAWDAAWHYAVPYEQFAALVAAEE
ncbi:DUF6879 family protein [Streptomyces sp. NPDC003480]